jgi:predicted permease
MREGNNAIGYRTSPAEVPDNQKPMALANSVTPDYLQAMGIKLLRGRFFTPQDRLGNEAVAVVDDVMAAQVWNGSDPIGQHLWIGLGTDPLRVVGVVGHVRYWGPATDDAAKVRAQIYYPFAQVPDKLIRRWSELMSIAVRTATPPLGLVGGLRHELRGASSDQVLFEVRTMEDLARSALDRQRFLLVLFGIFAGLALLLASIGIYGVLAYLTSRRVPEFGVRIALGATARDVTRLVLRQSFGMIAAGVLLGLAGALAAARLLQRLVDGMQPGGPATFTMMVAILMLAALAASFFPARRAGRLDAMKALRQE